MPEIKYQLIERKTKVSLPKNLGFGTIFTDHMFEMDYDPEHGWHNASIKPYGNLVISPASMFIHYGQIIFEGLKAFRTAADEIVIFRPDKHLKRLNNSAKRLTMPEIDEKFVLNALKELIKLEKDWIPANHGESLYIRPFMLGTDSILGVNPSKRYKFLIILSPVGAYYPEGFKPVKILAQDDFVRTIRKGLGECKTAGNYAASLFASEFAKRKGFTQVLWLDGVEQRYIEEIGTMNIFIRFKDEVATPKLTGGILPGITRESVIHILKEWGMNVQERLISIDELISEYQKGNVLGIFGTGTAAVISSVGWMAYKDINMIINGGEPGELALKLFNEITSLHYGLKEDKYNWLTYVEKNVVEV